LVSVGPFAAPDDLSIVGPPPDKREVSGHYPAFNYYEPSDSSKGIGLPFPLGL